MLEVQAATVPPLEARSRPRESMVQDVAKLTRGVVEDLEKEKRLVSGAWSRHSRNDVSLDRSAGCLPRRGIRRCWCGAAVRVCQTLSAILKFLTTVLVLVASFLLVSGQSPGSQQNFHCFDFAGDWRCWKY